MKKDGIASFIRKTWQILNTGHYSEILRWNEQGDCFRIVNRQKLCEIILPTFFRHSNFSSFVRQLNMYNFHKNKSQQIEFKHKLFRKNCKYLSQTSRQLLIGIKRKPCEVQILWEDKLIQRMMQNQRIHQKEKDNQKNQQNSSMKENIFFSSDGQFQINIDTNEKKQSKNSYTADKSHKILTKDIFIVSISSFIFKFI